MVDAALKSGSRAEKTGTSSQGLGDVAGLIDTDVIMKKLGGRLIGYLGQRVIMDLVLLFLVSSLIGNIRLGDLFGGRR